MFISLTVSSESTPIVKRDKRIEERYLILFERTRITLRANTSTQRSSKQKRMLDIQDSCPTWTGTHRIFRASEENGGKNIFGHVGCNARNGRNSRSTSKRRCLFEKSVLAIVLSLCGWINRDGDSRNERRMATTERIEEWRNRRGLLIFRRKRER